MTRDQPTHDPRLPILGELEERLRADASGLTFGPASASPAGADAARASAAVPVAAPADALGRSHGAGAREDAAAPRRRSRDRPARRGALRVARRVLVLVVPAGLAAATALAARSLVVDAPDAPPRATAAAQLGAGTDRGEPWSVAASRRGSAVCLSLFAADGLATRCAAPPRAGAVVLDGTRSPRARWVVGLAGRDVQRVAVRVGARRATVATHAVPAADARAARLPADVRWFVVALPREPGRRASPAVVRPLDAAGRATGRGAVTCNAGAATAACERARRPG